MSRLTYTLYQQFTMNYYDVEIETKFCSLKVDVNMFFIRFIFWQEQQRRPCDIDFITTSEEKFDSCNSNNENSYHQLCDSKSFVFMLTL
ncbi:unnamed protein product [Adineta ricciae]|uniref:Uncharacterized protein n=1 Tax=Adineta ricciae TaxID=249248 RepID=A0A815D211_ADIRI|nr:unnamed protein product [Adineta ricciae]